MRKRLFLMFATMSVLVLSAFSGEGLFPAESSVVQLIQLPENSSVANGVVQSVRLAPSGGAQLLCGGVMLALAQSRAECAVPWVPGVGKGQVVRDFCWTDSHTLILLQKTNLKVVQRDGCKKNYVLPWSGMRLSRADAGHVYLYGGDPESDQYDVLLLDVENGQAETLLRSPEPVTAFAGNGTVAFAALNDLLLFLSPGSEPVAVFHADKPITQLALGDEAVVFFVTSEGVGCLATANKGVTFWQEEVLSIDCRAGHLLALTADRRVVLVDHTDQFPSFIEDLAGLGVAPSL